MTLKKTTITLSFPTWVRGLDLVTGIIAVLVGFWIILDVSLAQLTILFLFSFALALIGFTRLVKVATTPDEIMKRSSRVLNTVAGVISIISAAYVFTFPLLTILLSIAILGIALMLMGAARLFMGAVEDELPIWMRALLIIIGLLTIGLSLLTIAFPGFGFIILAMLISIMLIINGFTRLVSGITGRY
ncbi:MAG: DUF308 domain-containing protein [Candidatus Thorarchaeota archaeon]|jgi:uncharacterized membrane protein HdeD (DUF308 family)